VVLSTKKGQKAERKMNQEEGKEKKRKPESNMHTRQFFLSVLFLLLVLSLLILPSPPRHHSKQWPSFFSPNSLLINN